MAKTRSTAATRRRQATDEDLERFAEQADSDVLGCRSEAHNFPKPSEIGWNFKVSGSFHIRTFTCKDCGRATRTQRWDIITNRTGVVTRMDYVDTKMSYGDGYLLPAGSGRSRKTQWREVVARTAVVGKKIQIEVED